eukprot:353470-Chlamydomonas_euryale.AAC.5
MARGRACVSLYTWLDGMRGCGAHARGEKWCGSRMKHERVAAGCKVGRLSRCDFGMDAPPHHHRAGLPPYLPNLLPKKCEQATNPEAQLHLLIAHAFPKQVWELGNSPGSPAPPAGRSRPP